MFVKKAGESALVTARELASRELASSELASSELASRELASRELASTGLASPKRASKPNLHADCPIRGVLDRIGDKWSYLLILKLSKRAHRFGELRRSIDDISQRMLTEKLRSLQRDGLIDRKVFSTTPPSVEYSLTDLGQTLLAPMQGLVQWANAKLPVVRQARDVFDGGGAR